MPQPLHRIKACICQHSVWLHTVKQLLRQQYSCLRCEDNFHKKELIFNAFKVCLRICRKQKKCKLQLFLPIFLRFRSVILLFHTFWLQLCEISHKQNSSSLQSEILHSGNFKDKLRSRTIWIRSGLCDCRKQKQLLKDYFKHPQFKNCSSAY